MSFVSLFLEASLSGWSASSTSAYVGSVMLSQMTGALWFSPILFSRPWIRTAFPTLQTEQELKDYAQAHIQPLHCYASAMAGATLAFLVLRGMIRVTGVKGSSDGALLGIILVSAGSFFGMMHPFFEDRSLLLYVINQGYHLVCFSMAGALMATFQ